MSNSPVISCIMPVYNCENYLSQAIESILNQSFKSFELIIINDKSTDRSEDIIKSYRDSRIVYIKNEKNLGIVYSLNKGLEIAKGKYIARMDGDDIAYPDRFKKQFEYLEENDDIGLISCWFEMIGGRNGIIKYDTDSEYVKCKLLFSLQLLHPGWMFRKKEFNKYGIKYEEEYKFAEDYALLAKAARYIKMTNIGEVLMKYRVSDFQTSYIQKNVQYEISKTIKKLLFNNLGIKLKDEEIKIFQEYANQLKICSFEKIKILDDIYCRLIEQNERIGYYKKEVLKEILEKSYFDLCYYNLLNKSEAGKYYLKSKVRTYNRKRNLIKYIIRFAALNME